MHNNSSLTSFLLRRIAAFLYDTLLLVAIFFVFTAILIAYNDGEAIKNQGFIIVLYVIGFFFFSWFWMHGGQTLGMRAWRIKLVTDNASEIKLAHCVKRYLTGTLLFGVTLLYVLVDKQRRALHDRLSDTLIIIKNK